MRKYSTDWLASIPVFYNEKTLKISHNINDVVDWCDIEFHSEGLNNYLDFGYSVFQQTPLKNIKFLRHSSEIWVENNKLKIVENPDPVIKWFEENPGYKNEEEVLELIKKKVRTWEKRIKDNIIIPVSGGYDSRLLAYCIKDKSKLKAFTYGVSNKQEESFQVFVARNFCEKFGINWCQIKLGDFHKYLNDWDGLFGVSTHAHGMYHFEFYEKIRNTLAKGNNLISGIGGDWWSGSFSKVKINSPEDLFYLGYTHNLNAKSKYSKLERCNDLKNEYFNLNRGKLEDWKYQSIAMARLKIILISYLFRVPSFLKFEPFYPYLDMDIALSMLSIKPDRREKRIWQKELFKKEKMDFQSSLRKMSKVNTLNHQAMKKNKFKALNVEMLSEIIQEEYIRKINTVLLQTPFLYKIIPQIKASRINPYFIRKVLEVFSKLGLNDKFLEFYYAYLTLKPIENVLYEKNKYLEKGHI